MDKYKLFDQLMELFQDPDIRNWQFYPDFRRQWEPVLKKALHSSVEYFPLDGDNVYPVEHSFADVDIVYHFDQLKIADWYQKDSKQKKRIVFRPRKLKRDRKGILRFDQTVCDYDPSQPEPALTEKEKNIICAALPGLPPKLNIVYGNKWVDSRFTRFNKTRLSLFFIDTDYVPAFLATPLEICSYLFMMDYCIIKQNHAAVRPEELKPLLHISRPSPMLRIKGLA